MNMAKARLSGPPAIEPVAIPVDEYEPDMTAARGDAQNAGHEPVSPLSPRSEAIMARRQNTVRRVSPVNTPTRSRSTARGRQPGPQRTRPAQTARSAPRESYPPASIRICPPRKAVVGTQPSRQGTVNAQNPVLVNQERHYSVRPEHSHTSRPRSRTFQAIPETFLQDFADHAAPAPQPSRSASVPPRQPQSQPQHQKPTYYSSCAHCGTLQRSQPTAFLACPTCRGVFYCSTTCWARRVCHRSVKCHICDCTQASSAAMDFKRCHRCKDKNREFWYCSEDCWGKRNCHAREDQMMVPPRVPEKARGDEAFWDARAGRRPVREGRGRDLEAQRAKRGSTPLSQRTGVSATVWALAITFLLLCIFIPIIIVEGKKNNKG